MALGPREKSELELHWQHQLDYVRADLRNIYRRMQNEAELAAFKVINDRYQATGDLVDLRAEAGALEAIARGVLPPAPEDRR
jgi:hypothetical protein